MSLSLLCASVLLSAGEAYPRPALLIEAAELRKPEVAKKFVVLDARPKAAYARGHVPGAYWVDADGWAKAFAKGQDKADWAKRVGGLGIDADTPVVVYGVGASPDAARVWWVLRYWGVKDVRLLNGGWPAWVALGKAAPVEAGESKPKPVKATLAPQADRLATKDDLLAALKGKKWQVLDARSEAEHCGDAGAAKRKGAIPGALHLEWSDALDKKTGKFKAPAELKKLLKEAGIDPAKPAATYCQSGGRAALLAFTVELMGGKEVRNYYRSWSEWGNDPDTPVVKPKKK